MKMQSNIRDVILRNKITQYLLEDEVVMNWSILKKCMLMLILGSAIHLIWIVWKAAIILSPELWQWVNLPLVKSQLWTNIVFFVLLIGLIWPCYAWKNSPKVQKILPYLAVGIFVISLCRDGYLVGVMSPATMISYVSLVTVGLVLFTRKIVYSMLIPATIFLAISMYFSLRGDIAYAPLFQPDAYGYKNSFWLFSMIFFILPILLTCLALFEILLSQWRHREQLIQKLSQVDPLTNLFNRRSINQCLEQLDSAQKSNYALVLLDLDHFKRINDQYGHNKGDETLILVSDILSQHLRGSDVVGRFGGEEFILVLQNSNLEQSMQVAERCRKAIEEIELFSDDGRQIYVTASFGIAISSPELRPQQLLSHADQALYAAKAGGRNRVKSYQSQQILPDAI